MRAVAYRPWHRPWHRPWLRTACLATLVLGVLSAQRARGERGPGDDKFLHGDYAGALQAYRALAEAHKGKGKEAQGANVKLGRALLRTGDTKGSEAAARSAAKAKDKRIAAQAHILLAEVFRHTGRLAEARKLLEDVGRDGKAPLRARCQLGLVYRDLGEKALAEQILGLFFDDYDAGAIDAKDAEALMYVAIAARFLGGYQDANDTFREAVNADPELLEANVEWGWLFLDKYAAGDAEVSFVEVLKTDPHHPDAHAGMARVKIEQSYDVAAANAHIDQALASNPYHAAALALRAELQIDNAEFPAAEVTLAKILTQNPHDAPAHALRAAIRFVKDDPPGFAAEEKIVLAQNPRFARFYHIVAEFAVKEHRYQEAIALEEKALKTDPKFAISLEAIGTGYLRMGDEKKGLEYLNKAWEVDPFNVRTYNILNLFDDAIPKGYVFLPSKSFRFRVAKEEEKVLARYLPRMLERAYADMVKRYGLTPEGPITVELFADPDHYSVRTVGLPNLGALGVCFGKVITALSPSNGNINWGMVLWHELGHVFAIQLSRSRVPRWFTEGLSEYETQVARREWRRENDVDLWQALEAGTLPRVAELNSRFVRAKDMSDMVVAYHLSSVVMQFLVERWGFPKIVTALKLFGQGQDTDRVLTTLTGLPPGAFDAEFRAYLRKRLAPYQGTFKVRLATYGDLVALEKAAAARPSDAHAQADLALAHLVSGEPEKAEAAADVALALEKNNKKALYAKAEIALGKKDEKSARAALLALIAAGGDGYDARARLGALALREDNVAEAELQLALAKKLDPERGEPYDLLATLYFKHQREDDALKELATYVAIEQFEYAPLKKLVDKYAARKNWPKVKEFGEMALYINPYDADLHLTLGGSYLVLGHADLAIGEYESALESVPPASRPALAHLGMARAYQAKRDVLRAKKALGEALTLEPQNAEALVLKKQIK